MAYGRKGGAAKIGSRGGRKGGKHTVISTPYHHVLADIHKGRGRGGKKR